MRVRVTGQLFCRMYNSMTVLYKIQHLVWTFIIIFDTFVLGFISAFEKLTSIVKVQINVAKFHNKKSCCVADGCYRATDPRNSDQAQK